MGAYSRLIWVKHKKNTHLRMIFTVYLWRFGGWFMALYYPHYTRLFIPHSHCSFSKKTCLLAQSPIPGQSNLKPQALRLCLLILNISYSISLYNIVYRCIPQTLRTHSRVTGVINQLSYPKSDTYSL